MKKIGLALGGGGARGLAHIGVLKVLENAKIPIHSIAGTSMGAILGACYAVEPDASKLEKRVRDILSGPSFTKLQIETLRSDSKGKHSFIERAKSLFMNGYIHLVEETKPSFFTIERLEEIVCGLLPDIDISRTKIPFACVVTDLSNGTAKTFTKGSLRECVIASSSIAGVFPPVVIEGVYYNDGGYAGSVPVNAVKELGVDYVIACDVKSKVLKFDKFSKAKDIISRSEYITGSILNECIIAEADLVISPGVKHINWTGFNKIDFMIKKGEQAALFKIIEIKAVLEYKNIIDRIKKLFS
ncbi:MAG: patatin-like phospholipase family protein [Elusimicrobia bacterium]|nr:patatin-like phospholipase family protein [Candidatus Liberimonas magnetica]